MKSESVMYERVMRTGWEPFKTPWKTMMRSFLNRNQLMMLFTAFFLGRAVLLKGVMPFGFALFAASWRIEINVFFTACALVAGMLTAGAGEYLLSTVIAMVLFAVINLPLRKVNERMDFRLNFRLAITAFASILAAQMFFAYLQGFLLYDVLRAIFQAFIVFLLVFIFRNSIPVLLEIRQRRVLSTEEIISTAITAALVLSGFADIRILNFSLKHILSILLILLFSFKSGSGAGAAIGVTIGLLISMSSATTPLVIGTYAFCGLLAGVLKNLGKVGTCLGFIMGNAVLTLYLNGSTDVIIHLKDILVAVAVFLVIPNKLVDVLIYAFNPGREGVLDKPGYVSRIREMTVEKLNKFSRAFRELGKTFGEISKTSVSPNKQDISALFDRVADRVCKDCGLCLHCWDRNFYNTYQVLFKIIERLEAKGRVEEEDIPRYFLERCERINDFVESVNNIYELFKVDMVWKSKIGESRELVSQQLDGLSRVISNLAAEISADIHFRNDLENALISKLDKEGIKAGEVIVCEDKQGRLEITLVQKSCGGMRECRSTIEKVAQEVTGRKMVREENEGCYKTKNGCCMLKLVEEEPYRITMGVARIPKQGSTESGDSYTFMNGGNGKFIIALSDGMGSGHMAAAQSRTTISLLEQFIESGFDKDTAVRMINSVLLLKSTDDTFATIDMSVVDLRDGETEFVKIGAVPTFIKRPDRVETVRAATLPAGILSHVDLELIHKKVDNGDMIIMMTDGVSDSLGKDENHSLHSLIQEIDSTNPQQVADCLLQKAYENNGGSALDDMLVLVAKVWKKAV